MALGIDSFRVDGRTAVVTGAAQGIGAAVARTLADAGALLALCDRDADGLAEVAADCRALGATVAVAALDVRDTDAVVAWVATLGEANVSQLDILVNNAGGGFAAPFLEVTAKGQDALVRENFTSVTNLVRAVVPHMPAPHRSGRGGGGSIVNVTSIEAHRAAPDYAVYSAMKAAVRNLSASLALELGDRHVRVNCVAPDVIPTPGIGEVPVRTPLPYSGHVDDVAAAVLYLASDASAFVTGTTIHVDGGNAAAGGWHRAADGSYEA